MRGLFYGLITAIIATAGFAFASMVPVYNDGQTSGGSNIYGMCGYNGNIGINTANPAATLDINGTLRATNLVGNGSGITNLPTVAYSSLSGTPTIPSPTTIYDGTTLRSSAIGIFKTATISSGTAVFYLTADGTSTGTALFPNGYIAGSVNLFVSDASNSYQILSTLSNSNKTLTATVNKYGTANLLSGILGQVVATNGTAVNLQIWGY